MRYGCQIQRHTRNQNTSDVVKLQKKAMRIIISSDKYTSTKPLFSKLRILSFDEIVNLQNCLLVLNVLNNEKLKLVTNLTLINGQKIDSQNPLKYYFNNGS